MPTAGIRRACIFSVFASSTLKCTSSSSRGTTNPIASAADDVTHACLLSIGWSSPPLPSHLLAKTNFHASDYHVWMEQALLETKLILVSNFVLSSIIFFEKKFRSHLWSSTRIRVKMSLWKCWFKIVKWIDSYLNRNETRRRGHLLLKIPTSLWFLNQTNDNNKRKLLPPIF